MTGQCLHQFVAFQRSQLRLLSREMLLLSMAFNLYNNKNVTQF